ncbi:MAG: AEC family transporter [Hyphomicrobiaceae bacterium]
MLEIVSLIAPVFGLIGLGFGAAKGRILDGSAARTLAMFGYKVAMPALLFRAMANIGDVPISPLWLVLTYGTGMAGIWIATILATRLVLKRPPEEAPAFAMGASFSNGVMLGFPVILLVLGPEAATPMAFIATCETVLLWVVGTLHMGLVSRFADKRRDGLQSRGADKDSAELASLGSVLLDVAMNPLIIALAAGLAWNASGIALPGIAARLIDLLAGAAIPVSLFALGMSLAGYRFRGQASSVATLCVLKLAFYPALAFWLATEVFELPRLWAGALVIYVSMPVGANAFIFAARYDRAVGSISAAVAVSTILAVATVTIVLALLARSGIVVPV